MLIGPNRRRGAGASHRIGRRAASGAARAREALRRGDDLRRRHRGQRPSPSEIAYVGDRLDNGLCPAATVGLHTIFVRRVPRGYVTYEHGAADLELDALTELPDTLNTLLDRLRRGRLWQDLRFGPAPPAEPPLRDGPREWREVAWWRGYPVPSAAGSVVGRG